MRMICDRSDAEAISTSPGFQFGPLLPIIAATPASHDQDALLVGKIVERVALHFAFEPHGVEVQVADITKFGFQAIGRFAEEHVGSPASAANQDALPVHAKQQVALRVQFRSDLADPEPDRLNIRHHISDREAHGKIVKIRFAHLFRPPEPGIFDAELRKIGRVKTNSASFTGSKSNSLAKRDIFRVTHQVPRLLPGTVAELRLNG